MSNQLGGYIRRRRQQRGWNRAELARTAGIPYSTLAHIESSVKRVKSEEETLAALAAALDEPDDEMLRTLAGYGKRTSGSDTERGTRFDALLSAAPGWESALQTVQDEMSPEEQDEVLTTLEIHIERLRRRRQT